MVKTNRMAGIKGNARNIRSRAAASSSMASGRASSIRTSARPATRNRRPIAGMSRSQFLKTTGVVAAGVGAATVGLGGVVHAAGEITIQGNNDPSLDYPAVQQAALKYSTIYLVGDFDFGNNFVAAQNKTLSVIGKNAAIKSSGIATFYFLFGKYAIENIKFHCSGPVVYGGPILDFCYDSVIRSNTIISSQSALVVGESQNVVIEKNRCQVGYTGNAPLLGFVFQNLTDSLIKNNIITGTQGVGMGLFVRQIGQYNASYGNVFLGNNVQNVDGQLYQVVFGIGQPFNPPYPQIHNNVWVGNGGIVADFGVDNVITGSGLRDLDPQTGESLGNLVSQIFDNLY